MLSIIGLIKCYVGMRIAYQFRRAMELEVAGRRPVGRKKKTWSTIVEEDKLNIMEEMA